LEYYKFPHKKCDAITKNLEESCFEIYIYIYKAALAYYYIFKNSFIRKENLEDNLHFHLHSHNLHNNC